MKKKLLLAIIAIVAMLVLAGCGCEHVWADADCTNPKTCTLCQETEGAPLGHSWLAASCDQPKHCENCDATEGEALGHTWEDATCIVPKKCSTCHATEGTVLGHDWEDATTEAPKTCKVCQITEGDKIVTDVRFTTEANKHLFGRWGCDVVLPGELLGTTGYLDEVSCTLIYEFCNDGNLIQSVEIHDRLAFMDGLKKMQTDVTYMTFAQMGLSKEATDQAIMAETGMTMEAYISSVVDSIDLDEIFGAMTTDGVYFVSEGRMYQSLSWYNEFESSEYTLEDGVLIIEEDVMEEGGEPLEFKRLDD